MHKVSMIQISENALVHGVVKALSGRESFVDTDNSLNERIYTGEIFEAILGENAEIPDGHFMKITDKKTLDQLEELAKYCDAEYVQITNV